MYPVSPQITGQLMKYVMRATFIGTPASSVTLLSTPVHRVTILGILLATLLGTSFATLLGIVL